MLAMSSWLPEPVSRYQMSPSDSWSWFAGFEVRRGILVILDILERFMALEARSWFDPLFQQNQRK